MIWKFMSDKRIMLNAYSVACLLHTLCRGGQLPEALKLLYKLGKDIELQPHIDFCCIFLNGCWSFESVYFAEECLHYIKERGLNKNELVYLELLKLSGVKKDQKAINNAWSQMFECCQPAVPCLQSYYAAITGFSRIEWPLRKAFSIMLNMVELIAKNEGFFLSECRLGMFSVFNNECLKDSDEVEKIMSGQKKFDSSLKKEAIVSIPEVVDSNLYSARNEKDKFCKLSGMHTVESSFTQSESVSQTSAQIQEDATIGSTIGSKVENTDSSETIFDQIYSWTKLAMVNLEDCGKKELPKDLLAIEGPIRWPYDRNLLVAKILLRQSFNALCHSCVQSQDFEAAKLLFNQLQAVGLKPDVISYNAILRAVIKTSGLLQGFHLVKIMEKDGVQPDINTYNVILKGFCIELELDKAEALLERMLKTGGDKRPTTISFNMIFKACGILDDPIRALRVFSKMVEVDIKPNSITILKLVEIFGRVNFPLKRGTNESHLELARRLEAIETYMERSYLQHNFRSFNYVLAALSTEGMVDNILHRINITADRVGSDGLPIIDTVTFNTALTACNRARQWAVAKDVFKRMKALGFKPDRETYNIFMNGCAEQKKIGDAFGYFDEMRAEKIQPDAITYNTLIKVCCYTNDLNTAIGLMKDMEELGLVPCIVTFQTLLHCAVIKERMETVEFLVEHMHRKKVQPTIYFCEVVVAAYLNRHQAEDAVEALRILSTRMIPKGILSTGQLDNLLKEVYLEDSEEVEKNSSEILKTAMVKQGPIPQALLAARLAGLGNASVGEWNAEESWWAKRLRDQYVPL